MLHVSKKNWFRKDSTFYEPQTDCPTEEDNNYDYKLASLKKKPEARRGQHHYFQIVCRL